MLKKIALTLATALILLFLIEIILRLFFPIYTVSPLRAFQYDPELAVKLKPGVHTLETTDFQQELRVNSIGTANFQESFEGYEMLVFAIGDSYTQGTGLPADMSYPAQLDISLNSANGGYVKKYGVVNLGLAAYGGQQNLLALRRFASTIGKPSVILYLGCNNDYEDDQLFLNGYRHGHIVEGNPKWEPFVRPLQWLTNDLQTGLRLKLLIGNIRQTSSGANPTIADESGQTRSVAELEGPVLDSLKAFALEAKAQLVVSWAEPGASYEWAKQWAGRNNVKFADWWPRVMAAKEAVPELPTENPHSGGHHRGWVNRVIADEYGRAVLSGHTGSN